jgi:hypothetical protein
MPMSPFLSSLYRKYPLQFAIPGALSTDAATGNTITTAVGQLDVTAHLFAVTNTSRLQLPGLDPTNIVLRGYLVTPMFWPDGQEPASGAQSELVWNGAVGTFVYKPEWLSPINVASQFGSDIVGYWKGAL